MNSAGAQQTGMTAALVRAGGFPLIVLGGLGLVGYVGIVLVSHGFAYASWDIRPQTLTYMALAMALAVVCAGLCSVIPRIPQAGRRGGLVTVLLIGFLARLMMFGSTPVLEDDWHRYLWDGAAVAHGVDPYKYAPADAAPVDFLGNQRDWAEDADLRKLQELTQESGTVFQRVNYPYFKTIYPPVAQAGFGLAHIVSPFDLNGWRGVLLLADLISVALLVWVLPLFGRSRLWAGLYWWNPVVILEAFNAGHMDVLIIPFLVGAIGLARLGKLAPAVIALAGAAAVKFWPVLLAPALVRPVMFRPVQLLALALLFCAVTCALVWPQIRYIFTDPDAGLVAYSEGWRRHAFLFTLLVEGPLSGAGDPSRLARNLVALIAGAGALWFAWRSDNQGETLPHVMLAVTLVLLFASPTGYPWYQIWIAAFLPFVPRAGAFALMLAAPLYYLRFLLGDDAFVYQWCVVPIAFGGPLLCFIVPPLLARRRSHG